MIKVVIFTGLSSEANKIKPNPNASLVIKAGFGGHPYDEQMEFYQKMLGLIGHVDGEVDVMTNGDHIINACRVLRHRGKIDDLEIHHFYNHEMDIIKSDSRGSLDSYPAFFLDTWQNSLFELLSD